MNAPGFDGRFELGFMEVPDPFEPDKSLVIACNVRHDVVLSLYHKRGLNNAQFRAGNRILALIEQAEESRGLVCDPAKEPVDGGRGGLELSDNRARAARELKRLATCLNAFRAGGYHFARAIITNGVSFRGYGLVGGRRKRSTATFQDLLTEAARHFHLDATPCTCNTRG
jgi:hypothetical protein